MNEINVNKTPCWSKCSFALIKKLNKFNLIDAKSTEKKKSKQVNKKTLAKKLPVLRVQYNENHITSKSGGHPVLGCTNNDN